MLAETDANTPETKPSAPPAKFFPINLERYPRAAANPYAFNRTKSAAAEAPRPALRGKGMTDEQARLLLSIYPVHN